MSCSLGFHEIKSDNIRISRKTELFHFTFLFSFQSVSTSIRYESEEKQQQNVLLRLTSRKGVFLQSVSESAGVTKSLVEAVSQWPPLDKQSNPFWVCLSLFLPLSFLSFSPVWSLESLEVHSHFLVWKELSIRDEGINQERVTGYSQQRRMKGIERRTRG